MFLHLSSVRDRNFSSSIPPLWIGKAGALSCIFKALLRFDCGYPHSTIVVFKVLLQLLPCISFSLQLRRCSRES